MKWFWTAASVLWLIFSLSNVLLGAIQAIRQ